jgi:hypothetical protein
MPRYERDVINHFTCSPLSPTPASPTTCGRIRGKDLARTKPTHSRFAIWQMIDSPFHITHYTRTTTYVWASATG